MTAFEKFPPHELQALRAELLQAGLDSFQVAELVTGFLVQHGYGVSTAEARSAVERVEFIHCSLPTLQEELERLALVM